MVQLELDAFDAAVRARGASWGAAGLKWQLHRGPTYDKSAAWVELAYGATEAVLVVWTSGEAELDVVDVATGTHEAAHFEFSNATDLADCLDLLIVKVGVGAGDA